MDRRSVLAIDPRRGLAALLVAAALAGCAVGPRASAPGAATASPSPTPRPTGVSYTLAPSQPTPTVKPTPSAGPLVGDSFPILGAPPQSVADPLVCTGAIGGTDPIAVASRRVGENFVSVVVDFADPGQPREVCTIGEDRVVQLVDAHHLVVEHESDGRIFAVVDVPEVRYHWFRIPQRQGGFGSELVTVATNLRTIVWNDVHGGADGKDLIHLAAATSDLIVARLPDSNEGRCGDPIDSNGGAYTRSGSALFVLDEPLPETNLIVVKSGAVVFSRLGSIDVGRASTPQMALWSPVGETLYYAQGGSVWEWTRASGRRVFLSGVMWTSATISPDGSHLAYDVTGADNLDDVYLVDLATGGPGARIGGGHRGGPVFLSDRELFYVPEAEFHGCTGEGPPPPLVYDLATGSETVSPYEDIWQIWPATGTHN